MESRRIGSLEVSLVGLGCNNFGMRVDQAGTTAVVEAALDAGITFFDTADMYSAGRSEEFLGLALGRRRDEVVVATKFGMAVEGQGKGAHPDYVRLALEASLRRLGTDRIDLYQLHEPDPDTPIADVLDVLDECVRAGKVREIGCSNFSVAQLAEADAIPADGAARFASVQNRYSVLHREPESGVLGACRARGLAFLPYFPLESGLLSGKYRRGEPAPEGTRLATAPGARNFFARFYDDEKLGVVEELAQLAAASGHTILDLAIAWLAAQQPVASVIAGATSPAQVHANATAASWVLDVDVLSAIDRIAPAD